MKKHIDSEANDSFDETYYTSKGKLETTKPINESGWYKITVSDAGRSTTREIKVDVREIAVAINGEAPEKNYETEVRLLILNERNSYITSIKVEYIDKQTPDETIDPSKYTGEQIVLNFEQKEYERKIRVSIVASNGDTKKVTFRIYPGSTTAILDTNTEN